MFTSVPTLESTRRMFLGQHAGNVGLLALAAMLNDQKRGRNRDAVYLQPQFSASCEVGHLPVSKRWPKPDGSL